MTRRAIRFQRAFVIFALVFRLAPRTVNVLGEPLGAGVLHVRHDQAGIDTLVTDFDLDDHAARARPGAGLVTRRVEAGDLASIALIGSFGLHGRNQGHKIRSELDSPCQVPLSLFLLSHRAGTSQIRRRQSVVWFSTRASNTGMHVKAQCCETCSKAWLIPCGAQESS